MSDEPRTVSPVRREEDAAEASLRPQTLAEFVGQQATRENLAVFIQAARARGEALDHVLLHGPPGLGKTTLAQIVARELGVGFRATSGPVIQRAGDLAAILTNLQPQGCPVHRRDPSPAARDRGSALPGDGGLPARPDHRRGAGGALACASTCRRSPWSAPPRGPACWPRRCATASASRCAWCSTRRRNWS